MLVENGVKSAKKYATSGIMRAVEGERRAQPAKEKSSCLFRRRKIESWLLTVGWKQLSLEKRNRF